MNILRLITDRKGRQFFHRGLSVHRGGECMMSLSVSGPWSILGPGGGVVHRGVSVLLRGVGHPVGGGLSDGGGVVCHMVCFGGV